MTGSMTRRRLLGLAATAAAAAASRAWAQDAAGTETDGNAPLVPDVPDPLIIRPEIQGVDPRYAAYATSGDVLFPSTPQTVSIRTGNVVVFAPLRPLPGARLVVFSHGALADPLTYRDLLWHWTSHGYVVAAPLHSDAVIENGPTLRKTRPGSFSEWPVATLLEDPVAWRSRVAACVSCLDDIVFIEAAAGMEIDTSRAIIAGHGYGAYVAQLLTGATVTSGDGQRLDFSDPRFFAGIAMSPQGPGVMGLDEASWQAVASPMLYLVAENDLDFTGQPAMEKAKAYQLAKPGYKHIGFLRNASSNAFTGTRTNENERRIFEAVKAMSTGFLKSYSAYDGEAFHDMTSDFFERMTLGLVDEGRR